MTYLQVLAILKSAEGLDSTLAQERNVCAKLIQSAENMCCVDDSCAIFNGILLRKGGVTRGDIRNEQGGSKQLAARMPAQKGTSFPMHNSRSLCADKAHKA